MHIFAIPMKKLSYVRIQTMGEVQGSSEIRDADIIVLDISLFAEVNYSTTLHSKNDSEQSLSSIYFLNMFDKYLRNNFPIILNLRQYKYAYCLVSANCYYTCTF